VCSTSAILLLVKTQSDFYLIPAFTGGFQILASVGALAFVRYRLGIWFVMPAFSKEIWNQFREGLRVFASKALQ